MEFLFIDKEEDEKEYTNAEIIYSGLTPARKNLVIFNIGNRKYVNFFKSEIETIYEH